MRVNDAVIGVIVAVFAMAVLVYAQTLPAPGHRPVGPAFFPSLIAVLMLLGAVSLILRGVQSFWDERRWFDRQPWMAFPVAWLRLVSVPAAVLLYVALSPHAGFMPTVAVLTAVLAWLYRQPPVAALILGVATAGLVYVMFSRLLLVPLPVGPLEVLLR